MTNNTDLSLNEPSAATLTGSPSTPKPPTPSATKRGDRLVSILSFTQGLIPLLVAVALLWWFGTVLKEMLGHARTGVTDLQWARYFNLYSGVEALAYAAAGFLFGREVNRQRADRAEEDAAKSQQVANEAQSAAAVSTANGRALASALRSAGNTGTFHPEVAGTEAAAAAALVAPAQLAALRRMANELFPPERAA